MNDAELVKKILAGDEERFGEIVDRYARKVWALCASYVHNPSDCEDLVQESFVRSYLRLNTIREPNAYGAWLGQIARTRCLEWLRKRTREKTAVANLETNAPEASTEALPSESAQREEMRAFVRQNLDALPDKYREALYLYYIGGHSVAEAALFLDISESAMKKRLQLGREKLRDQVAGAIEEALGEEEPRPGLEKTVLAAIPFGNAAWLAKGGLFSAATAAQTGFSASLAGLVWTAVLATLASLGVGGYVYYTSHDQSAQADAPCSSEISDLSDASDLSDPSDPASGYSTPRTMLAQADRTDPENAPEPLEATSTSQDLVHWKWDRSAEPPETGKSTKALLDPVSIEFEGEHVVRILEFLAEYVDASIVIDARAVPSPEPRGMTSEEYRALIWERYPKTVPAYATDGLVRSVDLREVPLSSLLAQLLYPLGLVYQVRPFGIFVTTPEVAQTSSPVAEDEESKSLAELRQVLDDPVSSQFSYTNVYHVLGFVSDYTGVNIAVDFRFVAPPVPRPETSPNLWVLKVEFMPDGSERALIQLPFEEPRWYGVDERFGEYVLAGIDTYADIAQVYSEAERYNFCLKVEKEGSADQPAEPEPTHRPVLPPPDPRIIQQWLGNLQGNQYVTDGLVDHINLRDVELRYALEALLTPLNLTYENEGDYIFVSSPELLAQDNERTSPESEITPELREALADDVSIEFEGEKLVRIPKFVAQFTHSDIAMGSECVEIRRPESEPAELVVLPEANWNVSYCNLRDIPLCAALDALLRQYGLDFLPAADRILVGTADELSALDELANGYWVSLDIEPEAALSDKKP